MERRILVVTFDCLEQFWHANSNSTHLLTRSLCLWCSSHVLMRDHLEKFYYSLFGIEILMDVLEFDRKSDLHFDWHILWLRCDDATEKVISIRIMDPANRFLLYPLHFYSLNISRLLGFKYHKISSASNLFKLSSEIETFPIVPEFYSS